MSTETFTPGEVQSVIQNFLNYGEDEYGKSHKGYFSGSGFAARALRWHLEQLKSSTVKEPNDKTE